MTDIDLLLRLLPEQHKDHALVLIDEKGLIVAWLMGSQKMFGYQENEVLGLNFELLFTPEDRMRRIPLGELEISSNYGRQENDRWLIRKDGLHIWVSGVLTCLRDRTGKIIGFSKLLRDRTDLKEHIDLLRNKVRVLEAENQQKTIMMGTLAHELRNPLGALSNATQLIEISYPQDSRLVPTIQLIKRQVKYLSTLIEDLLETVRLQTGKVALQTQTVDLRSLLASAIENVGAAIRERQQKVELILPEPPITLNVDPTRLKQVFSNLLSNASKFSDKSATIWIKAMTENDEVSVRIEDRGRGISPDLLPRLFELFTQGETSGHQGTGLGLGLSLVKQYVELHGGSVQARSEGVGHGSEFIVRLPLERNGPT